MEHFDLGRQRLIERGAEVGTDEPGRDGPGGEGTRLSAREALVLAALAAAFLAVELAVVTRYGWFRDELYYLACSRHLDWGYVDHPPLSIALLAAVRGALGDSLAAIRLAPAIAGAATVAVTGLLARALGGRVYAQAIAAIAALTAPVYLGTDHVFSMNAFDVLLWTLAALLLVRALESRALEFVSGVRPLGRFRPASSPARERWLWAALGLVLGLGLLNKMSMLWFGAGVAVALILTSHRKRLLTAGPWLAFAIASLLFLPYVLWEIHHGWPTLEFMRNATTQKMTGMTLGAFARSQILMMNPATGPVWIIGLASGLAGRAGRTGRVLAIVFLTVAAILLVQGTVRASYLAPAYPMLLAPGAVAIERLLAGRPGPEGASRRRWGTWLRPVAVGLLLASGVVVAPLALPLLPVESYVRYRSALGIEPATEERHRMRSLPQHFADQFGWEEMVARVAEAYHRLPAEDRARCAIFASNYGEAGAIDLFGPRYGLPGAVSGHNSYFFWGPQGRGSGEDSLGHGGNSREPGEGSAVHGEGSGVSGGTGSTSVKVRGALVLTIGESQEDVEMTYRDVVEVGRTHSAYSMSYEDDVPIYLGRGPKNSLEEIWPRCRKFI